MSGKRWGECGTTQRYHTRTAFMDHTSVDEFTHTEKDEFIRRRRVRGMCEKCGRSLYLSTIQGRVATLICGCGFRTTASISSQAYKNAALISGGR